jgi:hypothetical protein
MGKKNNIVFNLTIDDLKELGIIKSKRRRKRKNRIMQYMQQNNIKSTSDHMSGFSNVFNNTSNLQNENLRLQNNLLNDKAENLRIQNNLLENNASNLEDRFKTIEDENNKLNVWTNYLLSTAYRPSITNYDDDNLSEYSRRVESIYDDDPNDIVHEDDNIDVAPTGGSDEFKSQNDEAPPPQQETPQDITPPQVEMQTPHQVGIRNPFDIFRNRSTLRRIVPVNGDYDTESIWNMALSNSPPNQQGYNYRLRDDGSDDTDEKKDDEKIAPLTQEALENHNRVLTPNDNSKKPTRYQLRKQTIQNEINEYKALGGNNENILNSKKIVEIRKAKILLQAEQEEQEEQKPKTKKGKKKK